MLPRDHWEMSWIPRDGSTGFAGSTFIYSIWMKIAVHHSYTTWKEKTLMHNLVIIQKKKKKKKSSVFQMEKDKFRCVLYILGSQWFLFVAGLYITVSVSSSLHWAIRNLPLVGFGSYFSEPITNLLGCVKVLRYYG